MENPLNTLTEALDTLIHHISGFNQDNFNTIPFEGSWTGARVAEHLFLAMKNIPTLLGVPGEAPERAPDQHIGTLKDIFLNFEIQLKSPDSVFPEDKSYNHAQMQADLQDLKHQIIQAADSRDLNVLSPFKFPGIGPLTRLETLWFTAFHVLRHNNQLKKILEKID